MYPIHMRLCLLALGAIVGSAVAGGIAYASIPSSSGVIHACYSENGAKGTNGTELKIVDSDSASCKGGNTEITWNQKGVQGTSGISGYETVTQSFSDGPASFEVVALVKRVDCPSGKSVLGGGGSATWSLEGTTFPAAIIASQPDDADTWRITVGAWGFAGAKFLPGTVIGSSVFAVCATVSS